MAFENFPYTNYHEVNLSWLLEKVKKIEKIIDGSEKIVVGTKVDTSYDGKTCKLAVAYEPLEG